MFVEVGNRAALTIGAGAGPAHVETLVDTVLELWATIGSRHVTMMRLEDPNNPGSKGVLVVVADRFNLNQLAGNLAPTPGTCVYCGLENNWPNRTAYICRRGLEQFTPRSMVRNLVTRLLFSYEIERTAKWN